jgi:cytochrome P450
VGQRAGPVSPLRLAPRPRSAALERQPQRLGGDALADVVDVFNRPETFSSDRVPQVDERYASQRPSVRAVAEVLGHWLVFRDPPDHDRLRGLLQSSFTPKHLASSRDRIQVTVDALLDRVAARGTMDFIRELAFPLPAMVIAGLMGAPAEDLDRIKTWSDRLASYLGGAVDERDNFAEASAGVTSLVDYFRALLEDHGAARRTTS